MVSEIKKINVRKKLENKIYPSLFEVFQLGDRVKRTFSDNDGNSDEYSGIIMAIYNDSIDIFWDTLNGKYQPQKIKKILDNCNLNDIISGNESYSPIKKERYIFKNIFKL